jgi:hypothetical protein
VGTLKILIIRSRRMMRRYLTGLLLFSADSQSIFATVANSIQATGIDARQSRTKVVLMYRCATSSMLVIICPFSTTPKRNRRARSTRKNRSTSISIGAAKIRAKIMPIVRICFLISRVVFQIRTCRCRSTKTRLDSKKCNQERSDKYGVEQQKSRN